MQSKMLILTGAVIIMLLAHCNKEEEAEGLDRELLMEATSGTGFMYYQSNSNLFASSLPSAHKPFMRVKFNSIAQSALDSTGKLPKGATFPNGSLIVKELYDDETAPVSLFAIMKKDSASNEAGDNWLWAEIKPDEKVVISVKKKGATCIVCHSKNSRDHVLIFDLF